MPLNNPMPSSRGQGLTSLRATMKQNMMHSSFNSVCKALAFSALLLVPMADVTAAPESPAAAQETRKTPALRNKVYEALGKAQKAYEAEDYEKALTLLSDLETSSGKRALNSYELANVYNMYGYMYYSWDDIPNALLSYQGVASQPDIPLAMELSARYTVAQLLMTQEKWNEAVKELNVWFKLTVSPGASAYVLRSQAYYQLGNQNASLKDMEKAIAMYRAKGKTPKEQWLTLVQYIHYQKGNIKQAVKLLEELLVLYPKKDYWMQLGYIYAETGKENKQRGAMESAYIQGFLTKESELVNLAYLYLNADLPYKAGQVLEKGLKKKQIKDTSKNMALLSNAWYRAQEIDKAIKAMKVAAKKSDKGELWSQLGNIYMDKDAHRDAIQALELGLKKGGVKREDSAWLSLGVAYFNTKQYSEARKAFNKAREDKRSKDYANQWLKHIDREVARIESLNS